MHAIFAIWMMAFKELLAKPRALALDVSIMIVNDFTWILLWGFLLDSTGTVRGWDIHRIYLLFAVVTVSFGLALGLFRNIRLLSQIIMSGEIDAALTLPVDTLSYLLVRRVSASNLGDVVFGLGLFFFAFQPNLLQTGIFVVVVVLGAIVMTAFMVLLGSLILHFGGKGEAHDIGFEAISIFSFYPLDMLGGPTKVLMFTVLPGAFITAVPVRLVEHFTVAWFGGLILAVVGFAAAARLSFNAGLRKYRSGSRWTTA
jgi:ABC-2 type transport system permease protein